jgi:hypothetical protein
VAWGGSACAALSCACPQLLEDGFGLSSESAGAPAVSTSGAGGEGLSDDGGADAMGGAGGAAPSGDDGGQSGAAGSGGSAGTSGTGTGASSCPFGAPELLSGFGLGSSSMWGAGLAQGSLTLVFAARPSGNEDVFEASRHERGTSFEPAALVQGINTTSDDGTPFLFPDALSIYFYSTRSGGVGSRDLYVATRASLGDAFTNAQLLANVNSSANDHSAALVGGRADRWCSPRRAQGVRARRISGSRRALTRHSTSMRRFRSRAPIPAPTRSLAG